MSDLEIINRMKEIDNKNKIIVEIPAIRKIEITKEDFKEYEVCRLSGLTNMYDLSNVGMITGLSKSKIKTIIMNYAKLREVLKDE